MSWYFTLLFCGLFLIGIEIFVPGGILGIFGAAALIGAIVIGFTNPDFPSWFGWISLFSILGLTGLAVFVWMKYLPQSPIGRALSLSQEIDKKDQDDSPWKAGMTGTSLSELRPAGKAMIEGQRADVIADDGTFIDRDCAVEIVRVSGNRIYVKEVSVGSET
jgi:membrane-bound serine protease (ClpP class)